MIKVECTLPKRLAGTTTLSNIAELKSWLDRTALRNDLKDAYLSLVEKFGRLTVTSRYTAFTIKYY